MSIDADLNAGIINENEARERRRNLQREADFGAMDGASKFVKGCHRRDYYYPGKYFRGFLIGIFQMGMPFQKPSKRIRYCPLVTGLSPRSLLSGIYRHRYFGHKGRVLRKFGYRYFPSADSFPKVIGYAAAFSWPLL